MAGFVVMHITQEDYDKMIRNKTIDECIRIIEETVWKDTDMLVDSIREMKGGGKDE